MTMPKLLFADDNGTIYDHPFLEMTGYNGGSLVQPEHSDLSPLPDMSKLYYHPNCPPYGYDPRKKNFTLLTETKIGRKTIKCNAVSSFIQQGWVRQLLPAMDYSRKNYTLPMWAYSAVGFEEGKYYVPAFEIENNFRWNPDNFDDRELLPYVEKRIDEFSGNRLVKHLSRCALEYHCFAAKNFFYRRWEAPIPTSPICNSSCLGCISHQPDHGCKSPQERIDFVPEVDEITVPFIFHLQKADDPVISFGQGCEGEPIMQWKTISRAVAAIRKKTNIGTINLNTNGSVPEWVQSICSSGLDSIRISINSARKELYDKYYQPRGYCFEDVLKSAKMARENNIFTMINYLIFPGITDHKAELDAMRRLIEICRPNLIHFKNLNIDPDFYNKTMGIPDAPGMGIKQVKEILSNEFPELQFGYFNRTKESFFKVVSKV